MDTNAAVVKPSDFPDLFDTQGSVRMSGTGNDWLMDFSTILKTA
jgi:hypothetical protein